MHKADRINQRQSCLDVILYLQCIGRGFNKRRLQAHRPPTLAHGPPIFGLCSEALHASHTKGASYFV